jgi:hypothetical protein
VFIYPIDPKKKIYPQVNFSLIENEEDTWCLQDHRESDTEIEERAQKLLSHLLYKVLLVVASSQYNGLPKASLRALGHLYYHPLL